MMRLRSNYGKPDSTRKVVRGVPYGQERSRPSSIDVPASGGLKEAPIQKDRLLSYCWCQSKMVHVTAQMVWDGQTVSCEKPKCQPPKEES